jgi:hypothetical protein
MSSFVIPFMTILDGMPNAKTEETISETLRQLFSVRSDSALESLRAPAGSFDRNEVDPLIERGFVEFDTLTGIACQCPEDWALKLTITGVKAVSGLT